MIEYKIGDIFSENAEALVNSVNCVGVMGRGIALQFKRRFPDNFKAYASACKRNEVMPGRVFVYETGQLTNPRYIINFPTKRHWRGKSRIEDIEAGLESLVGEIRERNIQSVALPPLGSDLGGLDWNDVAPLIEIALHHLENVQAVIFTPGSAPADGRINPSTDVPSMTPARASLVILMQRYLSGLLDPFITLLEVHKLMYFLQVAGEPLRLKYEKGRYGPYAVNMRHLLLTLEGHMITGYHDGDDDPEKLLELVPGAAEDAYTFLASDPRTNERMNRVGDLVEGFESSFGLELLATVHWILAEHPTATIPDVVSRTYAWGPRKKRFSERQIRLAYNILVDQGWATTPS